MPGKWICRTFATAAMAITATALGFQAVQAKRTDQPLNTAATAETYDADRSARFGSGSSASDLESVSTLERSWSREVRTSIQEALMWVGDYRGKLDGNLSGPARIAIRRFQGRIGVPVTGYLTIDELVILRDQRAEAFNATGFRRVHEDLLGIHVGLPMTLLRRGQEQAGVVVYEPVDQAPGVGLALIAMPGTHADLRDQRINLSASELVGADPITVTQSDWFIISGNRDQFRSYSFLRLDGGVIRGFILTWTAHADHNYRPLATAILNSFHPVGGAAIDPLKAVSN